MIFVFGSNLAGRHGRGAALVAKHYHGAVQGIGTGRQGNSYAIPTKDQNLNILPLGTINRSVGLFIDHTRNHPDDNFQITRIGCGLAGYKDEEIAPLFAEVPYENCLLDERWQTILGSTGYRFWGTYSD